jgi:hypothetical protein
MSSALQICNDALEQINIIHPGEPASGADSAKAVRALNLMIAAWARDGVSISLTASVAAWAASTAYSAGVQAANGSNVYTCAGSGTSASSGGPTGTGTNIEDGSVLWDFYGTQGPIDASLEEALIDCLSLRLCPRFGIEPQNDLRLRAKAGWAAILAYYISAPDADTDSALKYLPSQRRYATVADV